MWRHDVGAFSVLLTLCLWNPLVTGAVDYPHRRPEMMLCFDVFFVVRLHNGQRLDRAPVSIDWLIDWPSRWTNGSPRIPDAITHMWSNYNVIMSPEGCYVNCVVKCGSNGGAHLRYRRWIQILIITNLRFQWYNSFAGRMNPHRTDDIETTKRSTTKQLTFFMQNAVKLDTNCVRLITDAHVVISQHWFV